MLPVKVNTNFKRPHNHANKISMPASITGGIQWFLHLLSAIPIGFGFNAMLNPENALSWFELSYPALPQDKKLVDAILIIYGPRDIFMGAALLSAAYQGNKRAIGRIMIFTGAVAGVDGAICETMAGAMNHWGYGPVMLLWGSSALAAGW